MTEEEWDAVIGVHLKGTSDRSATRPQLARALEGGEEVRGRVIDVQPVRASSATSARPTTARPRPDRGLDPDRGAGAGALRRDGQLLAPNARTRMTEETFGELAKPRTASTRSIREHVAARRRAGVRRGAGHHRAMLLRLGRRRQRPPAVAGGRGIRLDERWDEDELLAALRERFPRAEADRHARRDGAGRRQVDARRLSTIWRGPPRPRSTATATTTRSGSRASGIGPASSTSARPVSPVPCARAVSGRAIASSC